MFKKTIQIPKNIKQVLHQKPNTGNISSSTNTDDADNIIEGADNWVSKEQQLLGDDASGNIEISRGANKENELDDIENLNQERHDHDHHDQYPKFVSDTSSSDLTQGTPAETAMADELQAPFATSDEANSASNLYSLGVDCSPNLTQVCISKLIYLRIIY